MTTLADARDELATAIDALDGLAYRAVPSGAPPYVLVMGESLETEHLVRGSVFATFALRIVAGKHDAGGTVAFLDVAKLALLTMLRALDGWTPIEVRRDGIRTLAGADLLTADVIGGRYVDV